MSTKIEWCQETWNPITGCSPISEGCHNCYARRMAYRLKERFGYPQDDPFRVTFHPDRLEQPLKWKKPRMIFVSSMGDLFHKNVGWHQIAAIFGVMAFCQNHTFLLLTKRVEKTSEFFQIHDGNYKSNFNWWLNEACSYLPHHATKGIRLREQPKSLPLPNVYVGATAENQKRANERIPILLQIPAAKRFVSIEPMLEPIYLGRAGAVELYRPGYSKLNDPVDLSTNFPQIQAKGLLDWVICGAETGPGARYMNPDWARSIRDQCKDAGVPFFMKKMSNREPIPDDLMIREYPS